MKKLSNGYVSPLSGIIDRPHLNGKRIVLREIPTIKERECSVARVKKRLLSELAGGASARSVMSLFIWEFSSDEAFRVAVEKGITPFLAFESVEVANIYIKRLKVIL